jgi:hypothetical protein
MLSNVNFWAERAGMALDLFLMVRIVALKLHRTYMFIALFALLSLFYDAVGLVLGTRSEEFTRVVILSRFLYALVYPLVLWDLFEEAKPPLEKLRKPAMTRMISSVIFISLWGLLITAFTGDTGEQGGYPMRLAIVIWTGSVAAALAFLWVMRRGIKANQLQLPHNTAVWFRYFSWLLAMEAVFCVLELVLPYLKAMASNLVEPIAQVSEPVLQLSEIALTTWCIFKLRAVSPDVTDVPANVNS